MLILTLPLHEKGLHSESFFRCKIKSCPNYMPLLYWTTSKGGTYHRAAFYVCISNPKSDGTGATTVIASV